VIYREWSKKKYTFGGQKRKNKPLERKNGIWSPKSILSCDISTDREYYMKLKKIFIWGLKKSENKPPEPKNGIWAPKSV
jgi:hypothetical protein